MDEPRAGQQGEDARRIAEPTMFGDDQVDVIADVDSGEEVLESALRSRITVTRDGPVALVD